VRQSELPPAPAVERFVARWALEAGGSVAIRVENGDARTGIADIASLPAGMRVAFGGSRNSETCGSSKVAQCTFSRSTP
jgi:hypothetical protein